MKEKHSKAFTHHSCAQVRNSSPHGSLKWTQSTRWGLCILAFSMMAGCFIPAPSFPHKRFTSDQGAPIEAIAVSFADTYFQPRWASHFYRSTVPIFWYGAQGYWQRLASRLQENDFEKMLDQFDVFEFFNDQFKLHASAPKFVKLNFTTPDDLVHNIIELAKCKEKYKCSLDAERVSKLADHILVLKVSYGLAVRPGTEQFGFTKYYRPYIRVLGILKNVNTLNTLWQQDVCVFGEDRYGGDNAEAYALPREPIISSFKEVSSKAVDFLVLSLDGQALPRMPSHAPSDFTDISF